jgi:hypothetical protein
MKRVLVVSYINTDVSVALEELAQLLPDHSLVIPVTEHEVFVKSAVGVALKLNRSYELFFSESSNLLTEISTGAEQTTLCSSPIKEILRYVNGEDTLAIAWDGSVESHMALHSVEDYGLEAWNIEGPLEPIEIASGDKEDLYEEMQEALSTFVEVFAAYIAAEVIEVIGKTVEETLLNHVKDSIDPFDEE